MNSVMMKAFVDEMEKIAYLPIIGAGSGLYARHKYDPQGKTGLAGPGWGMLYGLGGNVAGSLPGLMTKSPGLTIGGAVAGEGLAGYYGAKHHIKKKQREMRAKAKNRK